MITEETTGNTEVVRCTKISAKIFSTHHIVNKSNTFEQTEKWDVLGLSPTNIQCLFSFVWGISLPSLLLRRISLNIQISVHTATACCDLFLW